MIATALAILSLAQAPAQEWVGQFTISTGSVVLERGGEQLAAGTRAGIRPGDRVRIGGTGAAAVSLPGAVFVYLGGNTHIEFNGRDSTSLRLQSGELRALVGGDESAILKVPGGSLTLSRGAFRLRTTGDELRMGVEAGVLRLSLESGQMVQLNQGREVTLRGGRLQMPVPLANEGWQVDTQRLLAQALEEEMRRRRRIATPEAARGAEEASDPGPRPPTATQNQLSAASFSSTSAGTSAAPGISASAGLFSDAAQFTLQGQLTNSDHGAPGSPFPGNIHLVTAETRYGLAGINLTQTERDAIFPGGAPAYYSIGVGAPPTNQVTTSFNTASSPAPNAIAIPGFNAHVVRLDQYGPIDAGLDPAGALNSNVGYAGLLGTDPSAPTINGTAPLLDNRAQINEGATFALGEFRLRPDGGANNNSFEIAVRRSDQDRTIVKDPNGNDANDLVTTNPDVGAFDDVADPRFLPAAPTVKVPRTGTYDADPTRFSRLNNVRRAAATTILADQLHDVARRTGQTRFVIDGRVVDISGYRK